jgi:phage shock protein A
VKKVEDAFRAVEETKWTASNPEALARAEDTANAFAGGLSKYERQLEQALAKGDTKTAAQLEESIKSLRTLLGAVESTAADLSS